MKNPRVSIIILNWNGWKDTVECLESLYKINYPNYEVILVDNGSSNESVERIREWAKGNIHVNSKYVKFDMKNKPLSVGSFGSKAKLKLILNDKNYGFAEGNNIAIRKVLSENKSEYVLLLNNDTVVDVNLLNRFIEAAHNVNRAGIFVPQICYYDQKNVVWASGGSINWWLGKPTHYYHNVGANQIDKNIFPLEHATGCCMLISLKVFNKIGYFDHNYFSYLEDSDFCVRARKHKFPILFVRQSRIWHKVSSSSGGLLSAFSLYYKSRNRIIFMKKYATINQFMIFSLIQSIKAIVSVPYLLFLTRNLAVMFSFLKGFIDGFLFKSDS